MVAAVRYGTLDHHGAGGGRPDRADRNRLTRRRLDRLAVRGCRVLGAAAATDGDARPSGRGRHGVRIVSERGAHRTCGRSVPSARELVSMESSGLQMTPVTRLAVALGVLWSLVSLVLAFAGLGIAAFFAIAAVAAPLDVFLLRRSGRNTYDSPDRPPRMSPPQQRAENAGSA